MYKYVFDLDNTLVFTDELNSEAYNYALSILGKERIKNVGRITRDIVCSRYDLTNQEKKILVEIKQKYFIDNIDKTKANADLINLLSSLKSSECILWTSAEECRVNAILNHFNLTNVFSYVFYSKKTDIKYDLEKICQYFQCTKSQLKFYENDGNLINELKKSGIRNILKTDK